MEGMEKLLLIWINDKQLKGVDSVSEGIICEKARQLHSDLSKQEPVTSAASAVEFKASRGWFEKFRKRSGIHYSVVRHVKAANSDKKADIDYESDFSEFVEAEELLPQRVFNCNEAGLFWKKMTKRGNITKEESPCSSNLEKHLERHHNDTYKQVLLEKASLSLVSAPQTKRKLDDPLIDPPSSRLREDYDNSSFDTSFINNESRPAESHASSNEFEDRNSVPPDFIPINQVSNSSRNDALDLAYKEIVKFKRLFCPDRGEIEHDQFGLAIAEELRLLGSSKFANIAKLKIRKALFDVSVLAARSKNTDRQHSKKIPQSPNFGPPPEMDSVPLDELTDILNDKCSDESEPAEESSPANDCQEESAPANLQEYDMASPALVFIKEEEKFEEEDQ